MNATGGDLNACGVTELLDLFIANLAEVEAAKHSHTGRQNRLLAKRRRIIGAIAAKDGGVAHGMRPLLSHANRHVRLAVAYALRERDHAQYLATMQELAKGSDEVASDAKSSLEWDESSQARPPAEPRARDPRWDSRFSGRKPPAGMTRGELKPLLFDAFPRATAAALLALARPAIRIWPQPLPADAAPSASRFGGMPAVGRDWIWPTTEVWRSTDREPLWFLAQINCRDLVGFECASFLPGEGVLSFFGDSDLVTGCVGSVGDGANDYWGSEDALSIAPAPVEDFAVLPSCGLGFAPTIELPDPLSRAIERLALDDASKSRYWDLRAAVNMHGIPTENFSEIDRSKLFGWPDLVQTELDSFRDGGFRDPRLFLQIGNYDNGRETWGWGPGGLVYFIIGTAALKARRWEKGCIEMQCT